MAVIEIFRLLGSVFIDNDKANKSIDETDKKGKGLGDRLGSMIGTAAKVGAGIAAGASIAFGGLLALANKTAAAADEIDKLSERTGINREELQRWRYAAGQSGADVKKLEVGIKKLSDVMDGAAKGNKANVAAFEQLGISLTDTSGKVRSTEAVFTDVMAALGDMEQGAARNALGNDLLGKSYTEMLPLLNAGSEGMDALKNRADELGLVMSEDAVKANVKFGDTMDDLKQSFGAVFMHISNAVLPVLQRFIDLILENMPQIQAFFEDAFSAAGEAMDWVTNNVIPPLVAAFDGAKTAVQWVIDNWPTLEPIIKGIGAAIATIMIPQWVTLGVAATVNAAKNVAAWVSMQAAAVAASARFYVTIAQMVAQWAFLGVQSLLHAAKVAAAWIIAMGPIAWVAATVIGIVALIIANWDKIKAKTVEIWNNILSTLSSIVNAIYNNTIGCFSDLVSSIRSILSGVTEAITGPFRRAWQEVSRIADNIKDALNKINPFARFSPSLVDQVQAGVKLIANEYAKLGDLDLLRPDVHLPGVQLTAAGASPVSTTANTINFEGMFAGANINVRSDNDIKALAREIYDLFQTRSRGLGVTG